jgi:enhancing lycopene biosynthesis protein 2
MISCFFLLAPLKIAHSGKIKYLNQAGIKIRPAEPRKLTRGLHSGKSKVFCTFINETFNKPDMKAAVVLAGCGVKDGAEIHEAVMTLYAIDRNGGTFQIFAPNVMQHHVINHVSGEVMKESRNVMTEAARIARGNIRALTEYRPADYDALIFPGGFGVAKNLCTYAFDGPECHVDRVVEEAIISTHKAGKPIGALCISPVLIARVLRDVTVTIGTDAHTAADIQSLGGTHENKRLGEVTVDRKNRIVTAACYMLEATISEIARDADEVIRAIKELLGEK